MNKEFLDSVRSEVGNVLEVGCNIGMQLRILDQMGFINLSGIDYQLHAVEKAKGLTKNMNIIQASAFDIPFKDGYFDLVYTSGVLIHIAPKDISVVLKEIHRCAKKYIWGFEFFAEQYTEVSYRGNQDMLWKTNFCKLYLDQFSDLELVKEKKYPYLQNENVDVMFLLKKK